MRSSVLSQSLEPRSLRGSQTFDRQVLAAAKVDTTVRLFMSVPGVGPVTALSVALAFDDASRFKLSSSADAYRHDVNLTLGDSRSVR